MMEISLKFMDFLLPIKLANLNVRGRENVAPRKNSPNKTLENLNKIYF